MEKKKEEIKQEIPKEMTKEEAYNLIAQICSQFKGNLKDHQLIQEALIKLK